MASGLVDRVAKRVPFQDEEGKFIKGKWSYVTALTGQLCRLHPSSFVKDTSPEYVVFNEMAETHSKLSLRGITAVSLQWFLSLAPWLCKGMDEMLDTPPPKYDVSEDVVKICVQAHYIHKDWVIPASFVKVQDKSLRVKLFAKLFLEGKVSFKEKPPQLTIRSILNSPRVRLPLHPSSCWPRIQMRRY